MTPKTPEYLVSSNTSNLCISTRHIRSAIFNFWILYSDSQSASPKIPECWVLSKTSDFLHCHPPYWFRHFEFVHFDFEFGFRDPKKLYRPPGILIWIKLKVKKTRCALLGQCQTEYVSIPRSIASMPTKRSR